MVAAKDEASREESEGRARGERAKCKTVRALIVEPCDEDEKAERGGG
jgi:hypothetical protein